MRSIKEVIRNWLEVPESDSRVIEIVDKRLDEEIRSALFSIDTQLDRTPCVFCSYQQKKSNHVR